MGVTQHRKVFIGLCNLVRVERHSNRPDVCCVTMRYSQEGERGDGKIWAEDTAQA